MPFNLDLKWLYHRNISLERKLEFSCRWRMYNVRWWFVFCLIWLMLYIDVASGYFRSHRNNKTLHLWNIKQYYTEHTWKYLHHCNSIIAHLLPHCNLIWSVQTRLSVSSESHLICLTDSTDLTTISSLLFVNWDCFHFNLQNINKHIKYEQI